MSFRKVRNIIITSTLSIAMIATVIPPRAFGEVQPITEIEDKLQNISEEEKAVLQELFTLSQDIEEIEQEIENITSEINTLQTQIASLEIEIAANQKDYDLQLGILKQVLVNYQRGGPASYLEILLSSDNLSTFLKSLNVIKDISHNVNELLVSLEDGKELLQEEKTQLDEKKVSLGKAKDELVADLQAKQQLQKKQEDYLASLQTDRVYYQEQLDSLAQLWGNCRTLFPSISTEISSIISAGYFTLEDLNLEYGFFTISGFIGEETFNQILSENSTFTQTIFSLDDGQVVIEVPEEHLVLKGDFIISGKSAIQYEVTEGTFYDMPLEAASIADLFQNGPLLIDFGSITSDLIAIDFTLSEVQSTEKALDFVITPEF